MKNLSLEDIVLKTNEALLKSNKRYPYAQYLYNLLSGHLGNDVLSEDVIAYIGNNVDYVARNLAQEEHKPLYNYKKFLDRIFIPGNAILVFGGLMMSLVTKFPPLILPYGNLLLVILSGISSGLQGKKLKRYEEEICSYMKGKMNDKKSVREVLYSTKVKAKLLEQLTEYENYTHS